MPETNAVDCFFLLPSSFFLLPSSFCYMSRELLQNVRVLDPVSDSDRIADILIAEGHIKAVEEKIAEFPADTEVRDCQGLILGPGLTDIYSHSGEQIGR